VWDEHAAKQVFLESWDAVDEEVKYQGTSAFVVLKFVSYHDAMWTLT
jgi:hypothetical protein